MKDILRRKANQINLLLDILQRKTISGVSAFEGHPQKKSKSDRSASGHPQKKSKSDRSASGHPPKENQIRCICS
jgi:hypothetical protein